jgi:hypothetical protein
MAEASVFVEGKTEASAIGYEGRKGGIGGFSSFAQRRDLAKIRSDLTSRRDLMSRERVSTVLTSIVPRPRGNYRLALMRIGLALRRIEVWPFVWLAVLYLCALFALR